MNIQDNKLSLINSFSKYSRPAVREFSERGAEKSAATCNNSQQGGRKIKIRGAQRRLQVFNLLPEILRPLSLSLSCLPWLAAAAAAAAPFSLSPRRWLIHQAQRCARARALAEVLTSVGGRR